MTNRLIGLIIILVFILLGIGYYYGVEKNPKNIKKNNIIKEKNIKKEQTKKVSLKIIKKEDNNKSSFALNDDDIKYLEEKKISNIKNTIINILKIGENNNPLISKIYGDKNLFIVENEKVNYIYNNKFLNLDKVDLNIKIKYAKKIKSTIHFITDKGTFLYKNNKIKYFSTFSDFIINNGDFIGIIKNKDITRKTNFNFQNISGDLIVLYNPKKSIKKILYKSNFNIKKILLEKNNIIIESDNLEKYKLDY